MIYVCSDSRRFLTMEEAMRHAGRVFDRTGVVIAIVKKQTGDQK